MNPQEIFIISASENSKLRTDLSNLFTAVGGCYGYRRLHALLKKSGVTISEKVVRRLMSEEGLVVRRIKHRKYSSYIGEISPEVANIINRDFHAEQPNEKWLTDITEFSIPAGKVYLSPIIDCFDGLAVTWTIVFTMVSSEEVISRSYARSPFRPP